MFLNCRVLAECIKKLRGYLGWGIGSFFGSFLLIVGPYWALNLWYREALTMSWWRVPAMGPGVFDSYVYLNWLGAAANGLPYGGSFGWYAIVVKAVWGILAHWASLPEILLATRWFSLLLFFWLGAWSLRAWSGLDRRTARWIVCGYAFAVALSIGMRPGAYSWYLPFAFIAYAAAAKAVHTLEESLIVEALGWSVLSLVMGVLYPWHFMVVGLWLAALWGVFILRKHASQLCVGGIFGIGVIVSAAWKLAPWFLAPAQQNGFIGIYERSGIAFARMPFFANTLLAFGAWIVLLLALGVVFRGDKRAQNLLARDGGFWITILTLWFSTPFTGIHLYSDHLIGPTVIVSWLSMVNVWGILKGGLSRLKEAPRSQLLGIVLVGIAIGASLFVVYVVQQPLRTYPLKFDAYAVHVIHWFALAVTAWMAVFVIVLRRSLVDRWVLGTLGVGCLVVGLWGAGSVIGRDKAVFSRIQRRVSAIQWLRSNIPAQSYVCADPDTASFYAAHTGGFIYPAESIQTYAVPNEQILKALEILAGAYDVSLSGNKTVYEFESNHYRTLPCATGSKFSHNGSWYRLLGRFGLDAQKINELIGCRQDVIDANWRRISKAIDQHTLDAPAFRRLCPRVLIPDGQRVYWQLPPEYKEIRIGEGVSVWSANQ